MIRKKAIFFYGEELSTPLLTPKLKDHPLSAVRDCFFNIFAATLHIGDRYIDPLITVFVGFIVVIIIIIIYSKNVNSRKIATLVQNKLKIKQANIEDSVAESLFSKLPSSIYNCLC